MRTGKRTLAGVAAAGLTAALIPIIGASPASATIVPAQTGITAPSVGSDYMSTQTAAAPITTGYVFADDSVTFNLQIVGSQDDTLVFTVTGRIASATVTSGAAAVALTGSAPAANAATFTLAASGITTATVTISTPSSGTVTPTFNAANASAVAASNATFTVVPNQAREAAPASTQNTPIRAGAASALPYGHITWDNASAPDDTITSGSNIIVLQDAPAGGQLTTPTGVVAVGQPGGGLTITENPATGLEYIEVKANVAGTYSGYFYDRATPTHQRSFSFTTTGVPTAMTLTPGSASAAVGQNVTLTVGLTDANGNPTQPALLDSIAIAGSPTTGGTITSTPISSAALFAGVATFTYRNSNAGSYTVTATPLGTLSMAAQSSVVTVAGTISDDSITTLSVTTPANALNTGDLDNRQAQIPAGTSAVTVSFTGPANATMRFQVTPPVGGVVNGTGTNATPFRTNVTLDGSGAGSVALTLGGTALTANSATVFEKVTALNAAYSPAQKITITQTTPAINGDTVVNTPRGSLVGKLGANIAVQSLVRNQFGVPAANYSVSVFRNTYSGAPLMTAVTDATGVANLTVTNAATATSGMSETYLFRIVSPGGAINNVATTQNLTVTWLTNPVIGSLTTTTSPSTLVANNQITAQPLIRVPSSGLVGGNTSTYTINPVTLATLPNSTLTSAGTYFSVTASSAPATNLVVTAPAGVKLVATQPTTAAPVLWSGGSSTLTVGSGIAFYVFATKTGNFQLSIAPAGLTTPTATVNFTVVNNPVDAYSVERSPAALDIPTNGIKTFTATVKDVFGNNVPGATVDAAVTGPVLLGGLNTSAVITTNSTTGVATVGLLALSETGVGKVELTASTTGATAWAASVPGYVPPTGAPAPVLEASVDVRVTAAVTKAIVIVGERTTVSGKSGIRVTGTVEGIEDGKTVTPFIRFPGETTFTAGSARPVIEGGEFTWQRKTGKRVTVYVSHDGLNSNRVTIQAG